MDKIVWVREENGSSGSSGGGVLQTNPNITPVKSTGSNISNTIISSTGKSLNSSTTTPGKMMISDYVAPRVDVEGMREEKNALSSERDFFLSTEFPEQVSEVLDLLQQILYLFQQKTDESSNLSNINSSSKTKDLNTETTSLNWMESLSLSSEKKIPKVKTERIDFKFSNSIISGPAFDSFSSSQTNEPTIKCRGSFALNGFKILSGELDLTFKAGYKTTWKDTTGRLEAELSKEFILKELVKSWQYVKEAKDLLDKFSTRFHQFQNVGSSNRLIQIREDLKLVTEYVRLARDEVLFQEEIKFPGNIQFHGIPNSSSSSSSSSNSNSNSNSLNFSPQLPKEVVVELNVFNRQLWVSVYVLKITERSGGELTGENNSDLEGRRKSLNYGKAVVIGEMFYEMGYKVVVVDYMTVACEIHQLNKFITLLFRVYNLCMDCLFKLEQF